MTDIPHGTISGYSYWKCRCQQCAEASRTYARQALTRRKKRLAAYPDSPSHGTPSAYNAGCRCTPCREAWTSYHRQLRARLAPEIIANPADHRHGTEFGYRCGCRCTPCTVAKQAKNKITNAALEQRRKAERDTRDHDDDWDQAHRDLGYTHCRPCREWHRPPECAIDENGTPDLDQENT